MHQKLSRQRGHRRSLVKNLATSLVLYERIVTTRAKARAASAYADRLIHLAKRHHASTEAGEKLAQYRLLLARVSDPLAAKKLVEELATRATSRSSGYTRRRPFGRRLGDRAERVVLTLTDRVKPDQAPTTTSVARTVKPDTAVTTPRAPVAKRGKR